MKYTNAANLPQPLVDAVMFSDYDKVGDISVSGLIEPPRLHQLKKRHDDEIVEDVADGIWRLIGSIGHKIVERANTDNHLSEERLTTKLNGWIISGKADLLSPAMKISDYKFTSVYAVKHEKADWTAQLNLYSWLYAAHGFFAKSAEIVAVLRDWSKPKAQREPDMPQVQAVVREVPMWGPEYQEAFALTRVQLHQAAETLPDDELPECTDTETWKRPDTWAVKKKGNKKAMPGGLHSTAESALAFALIKDASLKTIETEFRPGVNVRCESYCPVAQFCNQNLERQKRATEPAEEEAA